jgi:hypothetical protein
MDRVFRLNSSGDLVTELAFTATYGPFYSFCVGASGDIYFSATRAGLNVIVKTDATGAVLWEKQYTAETGAYYVFDLVEHGNVLLAVLYGSPQGGLWAKLSAASGEILSIYVNESGYYWGLDYDSDGSVYVCGTNLEKFDAGGSLVWTYSGFPPDDLNNVAVDRINNYVYGLAITAT